MPKRLFKFKGFWGGINDVFSPRDLSPTQAVKAQDVDVSQLGKVRMIGSEEAHEIGTVELYDCIQNYGLYFYSTDRLDGASALETGEDWILFPDAANLGHAYVYRYGRVLGAISADVIDFGTTIGQQPVY